MDKKLKKIKELKKNERFIYSNTIYTVKKKYVNDSKPLVGVTDFPYQDYDFHDEDDEVEVLN